MHIVIVSANNILNLVLKFVSIKVNLILKN